MSVVVSPDVEVIPDAPPRPMAPPGGGNKLAAAAGATGFGLLGAALLVALWAVAATRTPDLPSPAEAYSALADLLSRPFSVGLEGRGIGLQLVSSLGRVMKGFALAVVVGVPLGLLMGAERRAWQALNPIVQLLRPVSPLAWYPIWLAVMDDGPRASVWVIFITALWLVVINTAAGAATIPHEQHDVSRVFRFGRWTHIRHVLVPNALPGVVTGLRAAMGIGWMVIVAVEMMSGSSGIGFFVWDAYNANRLDNVVAAIVLIGGVGLVLDVLFLRLARRVSLEVRR